MFDYPVPVPRITAYREFGIDPEATPEEIRDAKNEVSSRIAVERSAVERDLEEVYRAVPGLREAQARVRDLQATGRDAALREASRTLSEIEQKASRACPGFKALRDRLAELDRRIIDLNRLVLENPEERAIYDQAHPPLALLKLADCSRDGFTKTRTALMLLRREVSSFLEKRGERVLHPSDLIREDFREDFTPNPLLDPPN